MKFCISNVLCAHKLVVVSGRKMITVHFIVTVGPLLSQSHLSTLQVSCAERLFGPVADVERYFMFCDLLFLNLVRKCCSHAVHNVWICFA